jgi:hypothetical protein
MLICHLNLLYYITIISFYWSLQVYFTNQYSIFLSYLKS